MVATEFSCRNWPVLIWRGMLRAVYEKKATMQSSGGAVGFMCLLKI